MDNLEGKVALVTGAAKRIGRGIALGLARHGADIVIHYRSSHIEALKLSDEIRELGGRVEVYRADFESKDDVTSLVEMVISDFERLDILVNNVGNYLIKRPMEHSSEELESLFRTNTVVPFQLSKQFALLLEQGEDGRIINIGYAGTEHNLAHPKAMAYQMSKSSMLIITRSLAKELGSRGVTVNMISPGQMDNSIDLPEDIEVQIPVGKPGSIEDILNAVLYLAKANSYVTGTNIEVSGGYRLALG